jgi:hypothetical protein
MLQSYPVLKKLNQHHHIISLEDPALVLPFTGRFKMFSVITNIYDKKTKGPTLMELFTATGKLKKFF